MQARPTPLRASLSNSSRCVHHQVAAAAVAEDDHGGRVVQGLRVLRPALVDDRLGLGHVLLDALGQQQAAGMVLVLGIAVAGTAGDEDDLLLGVGLHGVVVLELLEPHVAELHLHGRAGVDLQGDDAVLAGHRVFIDHFAHQVAVDLLDDAVSPGGDVVLVPVAVLDELGQFGRVAEALDLAACRPCRSSTFSPRPARPPRKFSP